MMLSRPLFLLSFCLLLAAPVAGQSHSTQRKYYPKLLSKLYLGMPLEELAQKRPTLSHTQIVREEYRYLWRENFPPKKALSSVVYYFDADRDKPLYEMVIAYRDTNDRQKWIDKRLGPPNHKETEWKLSSAEGFIIRAWLHENKLIFAGEIPGTEWGEEIQE